MTKDIFIVINRGQFYTLNAITRPNGRNNNKLFLKLTNEEAFCVMFCVLVLTISTAYPKVRREQYSCPSCPGARAGGMGKAHVAVANDAYANYWNPAGLGFLQGRGLAMMHISWLRRSC